MTIAHYINPLIQYGKIEFDFLIESDILGNHRIGKKFNDDCTEEELEQHALDTIFQISQTTSEILDPETNEISFVLAYPEYDVENDNIEFIIDWPPARRAE